MISLVCTHCQTVLSIDDAFAGGVCRCQHCGTIQTVPAHLKAGGASVGADVSESQAVSAGKALYQAKRVTASGRSDEAGSGTGLEDLADVVASSGLGGSGLSTSMRPRKPPRRAADAAVATPASKANTPILVAAGAALAALIAIGIWWYTSSAAKQSAVAPAVGSSGEVIAPVGPQFCGIPLAGSSVVYLLDRGDSAKEVFDSMKEATFKSIESLGPDRKFQILLWDNNTGDAGFPDSSTTFATKENLDAARKALEDVTAQHQSNIQAPLTKAVGESPDAIVIVTHKGFELDDSFASDVQSIVKTNSVKLYTVSIQDVSQADCKPLVTLAKQSGGAYKSVTAGAIRAAGGD